MIKILLYSPDVVGHPRVYCRVIADALADTPCELVIAMGFSDQAGLLDSPDLHPLLERDRVHLIDTRVHSATHQPHLSAEELLALQEQFGISTTLFIEADKFSHEFRRVAAGSAPRLSGRNIGIFSYTAEWHPGEDSYTGAPLRLLASTVRTTLGNLKRSLLDRKKTLPFFYEKLILGKKLLDEIIVKDERLADWFGPPVYWMPEISRPTGVPESGADAQDFLKRHEELHAFLDANSVLEPMLYFGDAAYYKGYDLFLEFIARSPRTCAIHAGRSFDARQRSYFKYDVDDLRRRLINEGRLLETNDYVHSQKMKELYFGAVRAYITTHRLTLSSSTVIQALEMGKPILVPNRGLLGHRVRANGLGAVYEYGDVDDLARQCSALWQSDLSNFIVPTRLFWERFSDDAIRRFFVERLVGS